MLAHALGLASPSAALIGFLTFAVAMSAWIAAQRGARATASRLREHEQLMALALSGAAAALVEWDLVADRISWGPGAEALLGLSRRDLPRTAAESYRYVEPEDLARAKTVAGEALRHGSATFATDLRWLRPDGGVRVLGVHGVVRRNPAGRPLGIVGLWWDVTGRQASLDAVNRLTRLFETLAEVNQLVVRVESRAALFRGACAAIVACGFRAAWIGRIRDDGVVAPEAVAGGVDDLIGSPGAVTISGPRSVGPTGRAASSGAPSVMVDVVSDSRTSPWRDGALALGIRSAAAVPLREGGRVTGTLTVYASETQYFGPQEVALIEKLAGDLAYAADAIATRRALGYALERERAAVAHLESVVNAAPVAIMMSDADGKLRLWNPAAERIFGWRAAEVLGHVTPIVDGREAEYEVLRQRVLGGESLSNLPITRKRRDGSPVELALSSAPVTVDGRIGSMAAMMDITESRRHEAALRDSEERFRMLAEHAQDVVFRLRVRPDVATEYVSPSIQRTMGAPPQAFYDDPGLLLRRIHPDDRPRVDALLADPVAAEAAPVVLRWNGRDGVVWGEAKFSVVRSPDGAVVALEGVSRDVTERQRKEETQARLAAIVEQTDQVVLITDTLGRIEYVNPAFERVTGYAAEEVLGRRPSVLKSGRQGPELYAEMWRTIGAGKVWRNHFVNRRKDGSLYHADVVVSPVRDAEGRITNYVGLQRDVTRERELDQQFRQAQKMESVGQLAGGIAHDFNNLLTVVLSNAALLSDVVRGLDAEAAGFVADIESAGRRGADLVRKLLAFSRRGRLEPEPVDLGAAVKELTRTLRRVLPETIAIQSSVPDEGTTLLADRTAVEQMVLNLATNARDAMPNGGVLMVAVQAAGMDEPAPAWVEISVTDTGSGMPPDVLNRIFEPFYTTKAPGKGTGLGMSMVDGLMRQMNGRVLIESTPGRGTTVRLRFPRPLAVEVAAATDVQVGPMPGHGELVLFAEDEPVLRRSGQRILERLGYRVLAAGDGVEALDVLLGGRECPSLVLTDLVMPRLGGMDLLRACRRRGCQVPFVVASGYLGHEVVGDADVQFIQKPWTVEVLAQALTSALQPAARAG